MSEPTSSIRFFPIPVSGTQRVLRYPLLLIIGVIFIIEVIAYFVVRFVVIGFEYFHHMRKSSMNREKNKLFKSLQKTSSYKEYVAIADKLDEMEFRNAWKEEEHSFCYDANLVKNILQDMKTNMESQNYDNLAMILKDIFAHCIKWFETEALYNKTYHGTKILVTQFIDTMIESMQAIKDCDNQELISNKEKIQLFKHLQEFFGRTALCLSGGATMSFYSYGVIKFSFGLRFLCIKFFFFWN